MANIVVRRGEDYASVTPRVNVVAVAILLACLGIGALAALALERPFLLPIMAILGVLPVSYTHLTLPTIYSV